MNDITTTTEKKNLFKSLVQSSLFTVANKNLITNWKKDNLGKCYLLSITHYKGKNPEPYDRFLKIGYSATYSIQSRLSWLPQCFEVEVLGEVIMDKGQAFITEQAIHKHFRAYKYNPRHNKWSGSNECYKLSLMDDYTNLNSIIDSIPDMIKAERNNQNNLMNAI